MGLDYHGYCLLKRAFRDGPFGRVATLGRQNIHIPSNAVVGLVGSGDRSYRMGDFCEALLAEEFMATAVHSFDASDYEGATFIRDFNVPLQHDQLYDTVLDLGTSEHIFNISQSFRNAIGLCAEGGRLIHVLPADNFNGHGFWQVSPELFFSLYSRRNGFADTEVFLAEQRNRSYWYQARPPSGGVRIEFASRSPTYVMAITTKARSCDALDVQQSDYVLDWEAKTSRTSRWAARSGGRRRPVEDVPGLVRRIAEKTFAARCFLADLRGRGCLSGGGPGFTRIAICEAVAGRRPPSRGVSDGGAMGRPASGEPSFPDDPVASPF